MLVANCRTEYDFELPTSEFELPGSPPWFFFAQDHALFGLILLVTQERRSFWPWADDVLFRGMNFGMGGFVIRLLLDARRLERVFTPIMGLSILPALMKLFKAQSVDVLNKHIYRLSCACPG
jgi:hypothetical protein